MKTVIAGLASRNVPRELANVFCQCRGCRRISAPRISGTRLSSLWDRKRPGTAVMKSVGRWGQSEPVRRFTSPFCTLSRCGCVSNRSWPFWTFTSGSDLADGSMFLIAPMLCDFFACFKSRFTSTRPLLAAFFSSPSLVAESGVAFPVTSPAASWAIRSVVSFARR